MKPRLLDLCCGPGGAGKGYANVGFEVVGVDTRDQPHYPFEFHRADALAVLRGGDELAWFGGGFAAIHASFPCQRWTSYARRGGGVGEGYPDLITPGRSLLRATGVPYVMENLPSSPLEHPVRLCGSSFGLDVRRHRHFETNFPLAGAPCNHSWQTPRFPAATNRKPNSRCTVEIGVRRIPLPVQKRAMGVDWDVTREELSQMVPPAYTEHIGGYLIAEVNRRAKEAA